MLHFHTTFIGSSYFIEELGDEDVDLEMPIFFLGRFRESQ
jgi:hypothetical protein